METPDPDATEPSPQRPRRWRRRLLALAFGVGVPFVVAEVAVRATLGAPWAERLPILRIQANAHRGWEMVPGEAHYTYHHRVEINSLGLRGEEVTPKPAGQRRVLALGDSLVYGQGVAEDETIPAYLEAFLCAGGADWDVVNAGHRAYDTRQELGLLTELGEALDPDDVVLFWYWNDIHERSIEDTHANLTESGWIHFDTSNRLEGLDGWRWRGKELLRRSALVMVLWDLYNASQVDPLAEDYVERAFERLDVYLAGFAERASTHGYTLHFAPIPDVGSLRGDHFTTALLDRAVELARTHGFAVIDLAPELRAAAGTDGPLPIIPFDGHYLPVANEAIARAAAAALQP